MLDQIQVDFDSKIFELAQPKWLMKGTLWYQVLPISCFYKILQNFGRNWVSERSKYNLMTNNCQDFCVGLAKFLDPNISAGVFPLCEAGENETAQKERNLGYASAAAGEGKELNLRIDFCTLISYDLQAMNYP